MLVCFSLQSAAPASTQRLGDCLEGALGAESDVFRLDGEVGAVTLARLRDAFPVCGTFHFRCLEEDGTAVLARTVSTAGETAAGLCSGPPLTMLSS